MKTQIPIYVISLSRTPERRLYIQRQLDTFGLDYQFVNAIDKHDLVSAKYRSQIAQSLGIDESNLEYRYRKNKVKKDVACGLSHIKAYNLMLQNGDDQACILEDDAFLLPTFAEVLKMAPEFSWDILMLSTHSHTVCKAIENSNGMYKRIAKSQNYVVLVKCHTNKTPVLYKHIAELLGFPSHLYPHQSKAILKILEEFRNRYKDMVQLYNPQRRLVWLLSSATPDLIQSYKDLMVSTGCKLGGLASAHNRQLIGDYHCIVEPAERCTSFMAYLLNSAAIKKLKSIASARNTINIDSIPWHLHTNREAKIRFVSLPCVIDTDIYLRHSLHQKYFSHHNTLK